MRRDHAFVAGAALVGLALSVFQVWYVSLPQGRAAEIDVCRWSRHLDCWETLQTPDGAKLLPILAAIAALFLLELAFAGLAAGSAPPRSEAWLGLARLASFPATGLALYVLLADLVLATAAGPATAAAAVPRTSPSAVLIALLSIGTNVHAVLEGRLGVGLRGAGMAPLALLLAAALFAFFLEGAAGAAREAANIEQARAAAPPTVIVPDFETQIPRQGAVPLGETRAPHEVLLFLDPEQEASRDILREILDADAGDVIFQVYLRDRALPPDGRAILEAAARGDALPPAEPSALPGRHAAAARITEYPTAIWKGGRRAGAFALAEILAAAGAAQ